MVTPLVSIGLPVRNGEAHLREALDSLVAQTFTDFEVILCDNASTDRTREICERYAAADGRFRYHRGEQNLGAAKNFNTTFERSTGKYFKWFAHDDRLHPDYLKSCVAALESAPESTVLCFPCVQYIDQDGNTVPDERGLQIRRIRHHQSYDGISFSHLLRLFPSCFPILVFGLARSSALRKTDLIGAYTMSDLVVVAQLRLLGDFVELPQKMFYQRVILDPAGVKRRSLQEDARWYDPSNKGRRFYPNTRVALEYTKSITRLGSGFLPRVVAYFAVVRFVATVAKRIVRRKLASSGLGG